MRKMYSAAFAAVMILTATVPAAAAEGSGRPAGCPSRWCGCYLAIKKGMTSHKVNLNLARNWAHVGSPAHGPAPGVVVVWRNHVGELVSHVSGSTWIVHSGNDGRRVRTRARSIAGAIAFRQI